MQKNIMLEKTSFLVFLITLQRHKHNKFPLFLGGQGNQLVPHDFHDNSRRTIDFINIIRDGWKDCIDSNGSNFDLNYLI